MTYEDSCWVGYIESSNGTDKVLSQVVFMRDKGFDTKRGIGEDHFCVKVKSLMKEDMSPDCNHVSQISDFLQNSVWNTFEATVDIKRKLVTFEDSILITNEELRNRGIGSYCFARLISEVGKEYKEYSVHPLTLSQVDAETDEAWALRDQFYKRFGFKIKGDKNGLAVIDRIENINAHWNEKKINEVSIADIVGRLVKYINKSNEADATVKNLKLGLTNILDENLLLERKIRKLIKVFAIVLVIFSVIIWRLL